MRRNLLSILFLWILGGVHAQDTIFYSDTLSPVFVTAYSPLTERTAYTLQQSRGSAGVYDIGNSLQRYSPALINSYGAAGAVATMSLRGTNDDQNVVLWNGIRLNSPASGTADISLLSVEVADKVVVIPSAQGAYMGSGSFGGIIDLQQNILFKDTNTISLSADISQFRQYQATTNYLFSNKKIYSKSSTWWQRAINDYTYIDRYNNHLKTHNAHNALQNYGFVTDFAWKLTQHTLLKSGLWMEQKFKETPTMMGGGQQSSKEQQDKILRTFISMNAQKRLWQFSGIVGYTFDYIHYTDKFFPNDITLSIDSKIKAHKLQNNFEVYRQFFPFIQFKSGYRYEYHKVNTQNYSTHIHRHQAAAWASIFGTYKQWQYDISLRQHLYDVGFYRPIISLELSWTTRNNTLLYFQYSDKYRLPDYNELYWSPGGNPQLKAEKGNALETGFIRSFSIDAHTLRCKSSAYILFVRNNIQWIPITSTIWSPQNLKNTRHVGTDVSVDYNYWKNKLNMFGNIIYNYNLSTIVKNTIYPQLEGHVMRYRPRHQFKLSMGMKYKMFYYNIYFQYISLRYTDDENNEYFALPAFPYMDMDVGLDFSYKKVKASLNFYMKNITQSHYEMIRSYATPPFHVGVQLFLHINTKK